MAAISIPRLSADEYIANGIAAHTDRPTQKAAAILTWGADEHVVCALAAGWWLYCRNLDVRERDMSNHILLTAMVTAALPHLLKRVFNQRRPDRTTVTGHWRGIPWSGKSRDAFPSGHAVHIGGLASAATLLPARSRNLIWLIGGVMSMTRVVLLAHWASDVVAGLALGALTERLLRRATGGPAGRGTPDRVAAKSGADDVVGGDGFEPPTLSV